MLYTEFDIDVAKEVWQEEAMQQGIEKGIEKGRQEGIAQRNKELAKSLLDILDIETIAQKTGLTIQEIEQMK